MKAAKDISENFLKIFYVRIWSLALPENCLQLGAPIQNIRSSLPQGENFIFWEGRGVQWCFFIIYFHFWKIFKQPWTYTNIFTQFCTPHCNVMNYNVFPVNFFGFFFSQDLELNQGPDHSYLIQMWRRNSGSRFDQERRRPSHQHADQTEGQAHRNRIGGSYQKGERLTLPYTVAST